MDYLEPSSGNKRPALECGSVELDSTFLADVALEQRQLYGDGLRFHDLHLKKEGIANPRNWVFFSPLHHACAGILTADLVNDARRGADVLVVGAGCGDIERYLINACSIDPKCLTAADIDLSSYPNDLGVRTVQFDMFDPWPVGDNRYRYILIPEALGMALLFHSKLIQHEPSMEQMPEMLQIKFRIDQDGPRAVSNQELEQFMKWAYAPDSPAALAWSVIERGVRHLAPGGELRINGHCLSGEEITSILVLADRHAAPVSRVSFGRHSIIFQRES
jgi:hypothetical protein